MQKLKSDPARNPIVGASSKGGWDHLKALLVAKAAGIKNLRSINYIPFDNGGKALLEVVAGRAAAFTGDSSEIIGQLQAGEVRILAVLSDTHIPALGDAKTAKEQGYDVWAVTGGHFTPRPVFPMTPMSTGYQQSKPLPNHLNGRNSERKTVWLSLPPLARTLMNSSESRLKT
jgi:tripartite-type tricarboxylate transporter receptor subunit TctC